RIKYFGVTHYAESAHGELETVMRNERLDFVQLNYAIDDRAAEKRLLPLATDRGIAILVNRPFGGGGLLPALAGKPLPPRGGAIVPNHARSPPAVTCAIPGTGRPEHMRENARAGSGPFPDAALRARLIASLGF